MVNESAKHILNRVLDILVEEGEGREATYNYMLRRLETLPELIQDPEQMDVDAAIFLDGWHAARG